MNNNLFKEARIRLCGKNGLLIAIQPKEGAVNESITSNFGTTLKARKNNLRMLKQFLAEEEKRILK